MSLSARFSARTVPLPELVALGGHLSGLLLIAQLGRLERTIAFVERKPPSTGAQLDKCLLDSAAQAISKHLGQWLLDRQSGRPG